MSCRNFKETVGIKDDVSNIDAFELVRLACLLETTPFRLPLCLGLFGSLVAMRSLHLVDLSVGLRPG